MTTQIAIEDLKGLTRDQALKLVGLHIDEERRIIGVDSCPGRGYTEGVYLAVASWLEKTKYYRVGNAT